MSRAIYIYRGGRLGVSHVINGSPTKKLTIIISKPTPTDHINEFEWTTGKVVFLFPKRKMLELDIPPSRKFVANKVMVPKTAKIPLSLGPKIRAISIPLKRPNNIWAICSANSQTASLLIEFIIVVEEFFQNKLRHKCGAVFQKYRPQRRVVKNRIEPSSNLLH